MTPRNERVMALDAAFRRGDLEAIRRLVPDPEGFPNGSMPLSIGPCLEYAIYHGPLPLVRGLLELGAETAPEHHGGFPPLVAALSVPLRPDVEEVVRLLIEHGADPNQRGFNDYTALQYAVLAEHPGAVRLLLEAGGDPDLRTRIDDLESARDLARMKGNPEILELLEPSGG